MGEEQLSLFGGWKEYQTFQRKRHGKDDYESFIEKFRLKHTTDDCFTPPEGSYLIYVKPGLYRVATKEELSKFAMM